MDKAAGVDGRADARARASLADVQLALQTFGTELLLLVSPRGELLAATGTNPLGFPEADAGGRHIAEYLHPDDLPKVFDVIERARVTAGFEDSITVRARHLDGTWRLLEATVSDSQRHPLLHDDWVGAVIRVRDMTDVPGSRPRNAWRDLGEGDRFLSLAESLPHGILSADARGHVVFSNQSAQQLFGLTAEELRGRGWESRVHGDDLAEVRSATQMVVSGGGPQQVTFRVQPGLFVRWATAKFVPLMSAVVHTGWIATLDDVTDRRRAESELAHRATHDPLTGLPNRTLLEDRLHQACARIRRTGVSVATIFVDLDEFKVINDTHGHQAGDEVLCEVARRLRSCVRDTDTVSRLGGDEFVILCEDLDASELGAVERRIEAAFTDPIVVGGARLPVGASVGVALTDDPATEMADLLGRADQAMYRVKREHRRRA